VPAGHLSELFERVGRLDPRDRLMEEMRSYEGVINQLRMRNSEGCRYVRPIFFRQGVAPSHEDFAALRGADLPSATAIADISGFMK
jgi:hypothetical protein